MLLRYIFYLVSIGRRMSDLKNTVEISTSGGWTY